MFYKIELKDYPNPTAGHFSKGTGFYWVKNTLSNTEDIHYYNSTTGFWLVMESVSLTPQNLLDLWEDPIEEVVEGVIQKENMVSETFALKAMAMAKANTQGIKITDILK